MMRLSRGYLSLALNEHVSQARDLFGPMTGYTWRPFGWGIGWKGWFVGLIVYRRIVGVT